MPPVDRYRDSGVDIAKGNRLVEWLQKKPSQAIQGGQVVSGIGGFAGLFQPDLCGFAEPLLVACTDGVGTKLLLGAQHDKLEGLGIDLVAMCVNDLYTVGARPLFFLDYFATGVLDESQFQQVLSGIQKGLSLCQTAMLGGETAELPGLYSKGHFDLAGFVVGIVDKQKQLSAQRMQAGDVLVSLESHGFHANGYSLIRKWLEKRPANQELIDRLLMPTRIYAEMPELITKFGDDIHTAAHITGGGLEENLTRVVPDHLCCQLQQAELFTPRWMLEFIKDHEDDLSAVTHVFNMGIGMIVAVAPSIAVDFVEQLQATGETRIIGQVKPSQSKTKVEIIAND